jgi:hypothetical protein
VNQVSNEHCSHKHSCQSLALDYYAIGNRMKV